MKRLTTLVTLLVSITSITLRADETRFASGLLKGFVASRDHQERVSETHALSEFLTREFPRGDFNWRPDWRAPDNTHIHQLFQLEYKGTKVLDVFLKTHYSRGGFLQYADSGWAFPFSLDEKDRDSGLNEAQARAKLFSTLSSIHGKFEGSMRAEPVIWTNPQEKKALWAYLIQVSWPRKGIFKRYVVDAKHGDVLEERSNVRYEHQPRSYAQKVYKESPLSNGGTLDAVTIDSDNAAKLINSVVHVRRDQSGPVVTANSVVLTEIDPSIIYANDGAFTTNPATYHYNCSIAQAPCANQSFDGVNVYYQLTQYRQTMDGYFADLGITDTMASTLTDPLEVITNGLSVDLDLDGDTLGETNNAAYVSTDCRNAPFTPSFSRCLVFLRPALVDGPSCGQPTDVYLYHTAREAVVLVHEYEHYITDRVTGMVSGTVENPNVGDALHEGYSDYFGASQVSGINSPTDVTLVGAYAFQLCTVIQREVGVEKVYANTSEDKDPHTAGLSWASGLWQLRRELGRATADKIALKSLFFLTPMPDFIGAVESLVRADEALNSGANVSRIRTLFYTDIKFLGGMDSVFRDGTNGVVELGLHSCAAVYNQSSDPRWSLLLFGLWVLATLLLGRVGRAQ